MKLTSQFVGFALPTAKSTNTTRMNAQIAQIVRMIDPTTPSATLALAARVSRGSRVSLAVGCSADTAHQPGDEVGDHQPDHGRDAVVDRRHDLRVLRLEQVGQPEGEEVGAVAYEGRELVRRVGVEGDQQDVH